MTNDTSSQSPAGPPETPEIVPPERTTPALLMSLVLHVLVLTTVGLFWSRSPRGTGEQDDRPVGIALVQRMPDRDRYIDAAEIPQVENQETTDAEAMTASAAAAPPADFAPPLDLTGILESMQSIEVPISGSGLAGEAKLDGNAFASGQVSPASGDSAETTTMLFGISGSGSRFVYVFDRSDSMNGFSGRPLRAAKSELIRSLRTLTDRQQFQIIFYNDKPTPMKLAGLPFQLVPGEESYRMLAENYIRSIAAYGGTEHEGALKLALRMSPDVVFFLTDARIPRLSNVELREIRNLAESAGATIHAIEFGPDPVAPADSFLRDLAAQNNGQYQYVNVRDLGRPLRSKKPDESDPVPGGAP